MSIRIIRVLSLLIMAAAAAVSFSTQRGLFVTWGVDAFTSYVAPIAVDLLAIICTLAIHTDGVARKGFRAAVVVLILTGSGSTAANFLAGQSIGSRVVHAAMVVLYLLAEWIAAQVRDSATHAAPQPPTMVPAVAPVSPGMPALIVDTPEAIAFREASAQLRRTSSLAALNGSKA
jgi:hypothetical protein